MTGKKRPERDDRRGVESAEAALNLLTETEERLCLTCLRYFRGDWDLYLDFLTGPRAGEEQRRQELPPVERLKERDQRTGFLELLIEDEVVAAAEHLDFEGLLHMWELAMLLDPEADPFREAERTEPDLGDPELGSGPGSPSLH
jgi:hypothetical protein